MELMTSSLEKTYKAVHKILQQRVPEDILGKIAYCVIYLLLAHLKVSLFIFSTRRDVMCFYMIFLRRLNLVLVLVYY